MAAIKPRIYGVKCWHVTFYGYFRAALCTLQVEEDKRILSDKGIKKINKETMIFLVITDVNAVRKLVVHSKTRGLATTIWSNTRQVPENQNSMATMHRLSSLHDEQDNKIFDSGRYY